MHLGAAVLLGLGLGVKHAIEADHLAAVCTIVANDGGIARAAKIGALWGLGHAAVIVLAGGALVATGASVPAPLALFFDIAVAVMLIALGAAALRASRAGAAATPRHDHSHALVAPRRSLAVGVVHGASGTAALTLLVASTINVRLHALAFVLLFGLASIAGMAIVAALVAWPLHSAARRAPSVLPALQGLAGAASIAAGIFVAWTTLGDAAFRAFGAAIAQG